MAPTVTAKMEAGEPPIRSSVNKHQFGEVHFSDTDVYLKGLMPPADGPKDPSVDPIKTIEHFRIRPRWLFVRVETEKGIVGWGEATLEVGYMPFVSHEVAANGFRILHNRATQKLSKVHL